MKLNVKLIGAEANEQTPAVAMYLLDASGQVTRKLGTVGDGHVELASELLKSRNQVVALGPDIDDLSQLKPESLMQLRVADHAASWEKNNNIISIPAQWWRRWFYWTICVSGKVSKCLPIWRDYTALKTSLLRQRESEAIIFPRRCYPICNGIVEVWEDTCCCWPIPILEIPSIIKRLEQLLAEEPIKFPVNPNPPDPSPIDREALQKVEQALAFGKTDLTFAPNTELSTHLQTLKSMTGEQAVDYIQLHPPLWRFWCHCSSYKVGETTLNPDGTFSFCWEQFPFLLWNCRRSFFYKVKQWIGGQWVYVYDGAAAYQYFNADDVANLYTYQGQSCGNTPPPPGTDFVTLQQIGSTGSWNLHSHYNGADGGGNDLTQTSEFGLAVPTANAGLVNSNDAPWAKSPQFMLYFHPGLKALGAYYYRLSIVAADSNGQPQGGATPSPILNGVSWSYFEFIGGQWEILSQGLGPNSKVVGGNTVNGLYQIPYAGDRLWLNGQFHQYLDSTTLANGRYLLVIEVFDVNGNRLIPVGATADAGDIPTGFTFLRLLTDSGPGSTATVTYAALTHIFWFDNRPVYGKIEDLDMNGMASSDECQFLTGPGDSTFQVGYRAFHAVMGDPVPDPIPPRTFMESYYLTWYEGLNGPSGTLDSGGDVNQPSTLLSGPNTKTPAVTFATLLGTGPTKCSFSVVLDVYSKATDGTYHFDDLDVHKVAAFAIEMT